MKKTTINFLLFLVSLNSFGQSYISPIKNLAGRIAYSADGDEHDTDDWLASPWSIALLRASGLDDQVVHFEYNNHIWSSTTGFADIQHTNIQGAKTKWGGFPNATFYNVETQKASAKTNLVNEINASSSSNPLWIIVAGPIETIGIAVDAAQISKLPFVTLISHSDWNNVHANTEHGSKYTIAYLQNKGVKYKKIKDQNGVKKTGVALHEEYRHLTYTDFGLKRDLSVMESRLKNHTDDRVKWLWTCRNMPKYEQPAYQKNYYDYSDAGMTWYLITGGTLNQGDEDVTPKKTMDLLEAYIKGQIITTFENTFSIETINNVYPNPSSEGVFHLSKTTSWEVFSNQGLKILNGNGSEINLATFPKGVYFLKLENDVIHKILIQ